MLLRWVSRPLGFLQVPSRCLQVAGRRLGPADVFGWPKCVLNITGKVIGVKSRNHRNRCYSTRWYRDQSVSGGHFGRSDRHWGTRPLRRDPTRGGEPSAGRHGLAPPGGCQAERVTVAHELLRRGVDVRIVDAVPGPARGRGARAGGNEPGARHTCQDPGNLRPDGNTPRAASARPPNTEIHPASKRRQARRPHRRLFGASHPVPDDRHGRPGDYRKGIARRGGRVRRRGRMGSAAGIAGAGRGRLTVRLRHGDDRVETVRAPSLVGCDGGHSSVRKLPGLRLVGESSESARRDGSTQSWTSDSTGAPSS